MRDSPEFVYFFLMQLCVPSVSITELSDVQYTVSRRYNKKKNRYGEITLCASNPRCITMNAARVVWLFRVTRFMNANILRIKSHARSLHHSPFSFLFRASVSTPPFTTPLFLLTLFPSSRALMTPVIGRTSTLDVSR